MNIWGQFIGRVTNLQILRIQIINLTRSGLSDGVIGALIEGISGTLAGMDKLSQIEGISPLGMDKALKYLCKKARIPDYK